MRLPRFSLRTLLVAIAIIAALLGARSFRRLSRQHSAVAAMHRKAQREVAEQRDILAKAVSRRAGESYNPDEAAKLGRNAWEAELFREKVVSRAKFADALRKRVHELSCFGRSDRRAQRPGEFSMSHRQIIHVSRRKAHQPFPVRSVPRNQFRATRRLSNFS